MTNREFYTNVIASETMSDEMKKFASDAIAKLDARNAKRAETPSKRQIENAPLIEKIASVLSETPQTASEIASKVALSVQKVSALVKSVEGVKISKVKVKGKGEQNAYAL